MTEMVQGAQRMMDGKRAQPGPVQDVEVRVTGRAMARMNLGPKNASDLGRAAPGFGLARVTAEDGSRAGWKPREL